MRWLILSVAGFVLATWVALGQQARRVDDAAIRNAGKTGEEWLSYGLTPGETRYSPLKLIDSTNVSRLGLSWSYDIGQGGGSQEATPLEVNGTIYGITNWSIVFAVDARTGKEKWRWDPEVNRQAVQPKICCGVVNRGLAYYQGKVIAPVIDGRLEWLDAETGKVVTEARVAFPQDNYTVTMAPRIAKGKVIVGVSGAEYPVRGFFSAYDANTGAFAWRFYTIPGDPSKPFENPALKKAAETWSGDWWKFGGGGTVWDGLAYDPDADLLYVGTGNGGPWPEDLRKSKGKDNLYVCSVLAIKPDTGELKWYYQMVPGDSWDFDSVQQLMLADLTINGRARKVIMQANKNGFYYVLDRVTGAFISAEPFSQVTWAKGIDKETGRPIINPEAHYDQSKETVQIAPGPGGAHNWSPMSYNPASGLIYIPTTTAGSFGYTEDKNFNFTAGRQNMGIVFGFGPPGGAPPAPGAGARGAAPGAAGAGNAPAPAPAPAAAAPPAGPPPPAGKTLPAIGPTAPEGQRGMLVAWDPVTQKEKWRTPGGGGIGGGTVTTAGNLVFQVIPDGHLVAYSADKGEKLLDVNTGLRGGMGPPITFMLDGKQYVALMGGTGPFGGFGPGGPGPGPGPAPAPGAARGGAGAPAAGAGRGATTDSPDVANAAAAQQRGAAGPGAAGPGAAAPAGAPPAFPPAPTPKLLLFAIDGKAKLPGQ
jgi:PQQ-dependent dehydrogenase (methanol/ethanol family)